MDADRGRRNRRRRWPAAAVVMVAGAISLSSCGVGDPYVAVLEGNYAVGQGNYQEATVHYLRALSTGDETDRVSYDLANVFHSLGEAEAALDLWKKASSTDDTQLLYGIAYNEGVQYYELGNYDQAYSSFRTALQYNPSSMDAKINLELSLRKIQGTQSQAEAASSQAPPKTQQAEQMSDQEATRVLEYIRRKEEQQWVPSRQQPVTAPARDW